MHSAAAAPRLTVSCKISTAKPFIHFRQRPPVLQKILGRQLTRDAHKAHWTSTPQRGELVRGPSLHLQRYDTESLHLASRKSRGSQWCPPYRDSLWSLAETPYFVELASMGRKTVLRSQAADFQQKRQLQDVVHGPGPSDGQVMLDAGRSHAEESKQASDISEQANKMPATKHIHLEARLAIFQKDGNLEQLTVAELRGILKLRNRPSTGRKQDLLQELKRVLAEPAELGGAEKQLKEIEETKSSKLLTSQDSEMLQQRRPAANATILGEDTVEGSMIKVYRSRRAKAHNINAMADTTAETQPRAKRTRTAGSGEPKDVSTEQTEVKKIWATFNHKKPQPGWYAYDPSTMRPAPPSDRSTFHKLISWNVNGIRALLKGKDPKMHDAALFRKLAEVEDFDVLCLQETKLQDKDVDNVKQCLLPHYEGSYWSCSTAKLGYSGTAIISRVKPLSVDYGLGIEDHDKEGRLITAEFETFYLVTSYVPNSGDGLRRLDYRITGWDPALSSHVKKLEKKKPVILTGDLNCCHEEMDIADPNANRRSAGFTDEERTSFAESYLKKGLVDTFRRQHPNAVGYTYWGYRTNARARNHGWRLDYFLASEAISDRIHDSYSMPHILGSDHCPIGLILRT